MNQPSLTDWITALGTVATPILVLALTAVGWTIKRRIERNQERESYLRTLEEKLRDNRVEIYNKILEPFIIALTKDEAFAHEKTFKGKTKVEVATEKILSLDYKQTGFKLSLMGSDNVVKAYNSLMQYFYSRKSDDDSAESTLKFMKFLGDLLLEIRRSVGNEQTTLDNLEMLEWFITDVRKYRNTQ